MDSIPLDCYHPFQKVSLFVFRRVTVNVPLHILNHLFTELILHTEQQHLKGSQTHTGCTAMYSFTFTYHWVKLEVDFGEDLFSIHVLVVDLYALGPLPAEAPSLLHFLTHGLFRD